MNRFATFADSWRRLNEAANQWTVGRFGPGQARWLILIVALLAWMLLTSALSSLIDVEAARQSSARAEIARLSALVGDTTWRDRRAESQDLRNRLEDRFWPAPTPGLAEASFEAWLRERFQQHGVEVQQILLARAAIEAGDTSVRIAAERMTAKVISSFKPSATVNVAADIAEKDKLVTIDRMIIRTGRNARMEMDVSAYLRK